MGEPIDDLPKAGLGVGGIQEQYILLGGERSMEYPEIDLPARWHGWIS